MLNILFDLILILALIGAYICNAKTGKITEFERGLWQSFCDVVNYYIRQYERGKHDPEIRQVKMPFSSAMVPAYEYDGRWFHVSEGIAPLQGNRKILLVWEGIVWMASRDPVNGSKWNLLGSNRFRFSQDIETWMPVPDAPDEQQPHDAFTRKPRSMYTKEDIE